MEKGNLNESLDVADIKIRIYEIKADILLHKEKITALEEEKYKWKKKLSEKMSNEEGSIELEKTSFEEPPEESPGGNLTYEEPEPHVALNQSNDGSNIDIITKVQSFCEEVAQNMMEKYNNIDKVKADKIEVHEVWRKISVLESKIQSTTEDITKCKGMPEEVLQNILERLKFLEEGKVEEPKEDVVKRYTVDEIRSKPWIALPNEYEVKCIWSRCEKPFIPHLYKDGLVTCPTCGRQTPIEKPPSGKKWMYFWNCWHIHCVEGKEGLKTCHQCGGHGDVKESNVRTPVRKTATST